MPGARESRCHPWPRWARRRSGMGQALTSSLDFQPPRKLHEGRNLNLNCFCESLALLQCERPSATGVWQEYWWSPSYARGHTALDICDAAEASRAKNQESQMSWQLVVDSAKTPSRIALSPRAVVCSQSGNEGPGPEFLPSRSCSTSTVPAQAAHPPLEATPDCRDLRALREGPDMRKYFPCLRSSRASERRTARVEWLRCV